MTKQYEYTNTNTRGTVTITDSKLKQYMLKPGNTVRLNEKIYNTDGYGVTCSVMEKITKKKGSSKNETHEDNIE